VIEARREGELFGEKRLEKILRRRRVSVKRLPQLILDQVLTFSGGVLKDDLAVLALSLAAPPETLAPPGKMSFKQESLLN
jgi:serine phosphatase RsbU (regulator of sigma subunit)